MIKQRISTFLDYLSEVERNRNDNYQIHLFRGQSYSRPLLPSIARANPCFDTTKIEIKMLEDLKRRSPYSLKNLRHPIGSGWYLPNISDSKQGFWIGLAIH